MRFLGPLDVRKALPMTAAIKATRVAFSTEAPAPLRSLVGNSLFMPGAAGSFTGVKVVSIEPGNPAGLVVVFDRAGSPVGVCDGPTLTAIRTGAAAALATDLLAPPGASDFAILGAGAMAPDQIEAVCAVRPIERIRVWSRTTERAAALAELVGGTVAATPGEAAEGADVITAVTPSSAPLIDRGDLKEGAHINAMGAFTPAMAEIGPEAVRAAYVVVDDVGTAAEEAGDLIQANRTPDAEIGDVLSGAAKPPSARITMFKSVGIAAQDVAAAAAALEEATRRGIGQVL